MIHHSAQNSSNMSAYNLILWACVFDLCALLLHSILVALKHLAGVRCPCQLVSFEFCGGILAFIVGPQNFHLSSILILHHSFSLFELLKYFRFLLQEVYPNSFGEIIYECNIVPSTPMDATGEGPHTSVCMRFSKHFVLSCDVELSLIHIWRCRRSTLCRSRWSPYH